LLKSKTNATTRIAMTNAMVLFTSRA
jgi:hypothetical protein